MFNQTGNCGECGMPIGRLKATSQWLGGKGYPDKDSITYHITPWLVHSTIRCPFK